MPACFIEQTPGSGAWARRFKGKRAKAPTLDKVFVESLLFVDKKEFLTPLPSEFTVDTLDRYLSQLQTFASYGLREEYLEKGFMLATYTAVRFSLKFMKLGYLGYVISKLDLDDSRITDEQDIASEIIRRAEAVSELEFVSSALVDYGIRALMEIVDRGRDDLNGAELRKIAELLEPLAMKHDEEIRSRLHTPVRT